MRAVTYCRFSTDNQRDASIEDQRRICHDYCKRQGWAVTKDYADKAASGTTSDRPAYQAMKAAAEAHEFDVLGVVDLSRLARDNGELQTLLKRLKFHGVRIIAVTDDYDSNSENAKLSAGFRGLMGDLYVDDVRKKVAASMIGLALKAAPTGGRCYGYKIQPTYDPSGATDQYGRPAIVSKRWKIEPDEAKIVVQIFEWFADGKPPKWIANELNRRGVPAPRGKAWSASSLYPNTRKAVGILQNELYRGRLIYNRTKWVRHPDRNCRVRFDRPAAEWVTKDVPELRIVGESLWTAAQNRRGEIHAASAKIRAALGSKSRTGRHGKYLFSGILRCNTCAALYSVHSQNEYRCSTYMNRGKAACGNSIPVKRDLLEDRLLAAIREDLFSSQALERFKQSVRQSLIAQRTNRSANQQDIERHIARLETEYANIMTAIRAGIVTKGTKAELEQTEAELERLRAMQGRNEPQLDDLDRLVPQLTAHYGAMLKRLGENCVGPEMSKARQAIKLLTGGTIWLVPSQSDRDARGRPVLHAHLTGSYPGFIRLAADGVLVKPLKMRNWVNLVAEERCGRKHNIATRQVFL